MFWQVMRTSDQDTPQVLAVTDQHTHQGGRATPAAAATSGAPTAAWLPAPHTCWCFLGTHGAPGWRGQRQPAGGQATAAARAHSAAACCARAQGESSCLQALGVSQVDHRGVALQR
jgi:hypothetical protein